MAAPGIGGPDIGNYAPTERPLRKDDNITGFWRNRGATEPPTMPTAAKAQLSALMWALRREIFRAAVLRRTTPLVMPR